MTGRPIYVEITITAPMDRVWALSQDFAAHARWDLRFSSIEATEPAADGSQRFVYKRSMGPHTIRGTGISAGDAGDAASGRVSALRFTTRDRLSPIRHGSGYWRYVPTADGVVFTTGYNYEPGWGSLVDRLVMRRMVGWMTAWSFDRLRIWAESGTEPERWPLSSVLHFWRPERPRARRTIRIRPGGAIRATDPALLATLEMP
jgi:hypothetical protein